MVRVRRLEFPAEPRGAPLTASLGAVDASPSHARVAEPQRGRLVAWGAILSAVGLVVGVSLLLGPAGVGWPSGEVLGLRGFRVLAAAAVGGGLGLSGVLLQALLRNPLASPDLLGLASGGGLGIAVTVYLAHLAGFGIANAGSATIGATAGCFTALGMVVLWGRRRGVLDPFTLLLVGVIIGIVCSAGSQFITHLLPDQGVAAQRMLLGAIRETDLSWAEVIGVGGCVAVGGLYAWCRAFALDCLALGDDEAASVGVDVGRLRVALVVLSGIVTAGTVVLAGPIGFVGIVAPHAVRMSLGSTHRLLIPAAAVVGAGLVVGADALVRVIDLGSGRMPISVITALVGGPTLVYLIRKSRRDSLG